MKNVLMSVIENREIESVCVCVCVCVFVCEPEEQKLEATSANSD